MPLPTHKSRRLIYKGHKSTGAVFQNCDTLQESVYTADPNGFGLFVFTWKGCKMRLVAGTDIYGIAAHHTKTERAVMRRDLHPRCLTYPCPDVSREQAVEELLMALKRLIAFRNCPRALALGQAAIAKVENTFPR